MTRKEYENYKLRVLANVDGKNVHNIRKPLHIILNCGVGLEDTKDNRLYNEKKKLVENAIKEIYEQTGILP